MTANDGPVILFDGVCNLCSGAVQFIIRRDPAARYRFASLQSASAQSLLKKFSIPDELKTFILIENHKVYKRSTAALRVARHLKGAWPLMYAFIIVPPFIRDGVYNIIGRYRYSWFGKKDQCMMPTPSIQSRFLKDPS
ncbi:MAG: thiol-disulfide oxidoreductase DCC family protein [Ferruginibacter sp.]|nr:thiol-disulfide oxidoreductase DCC family protein [Ferruginibacter sp.]